MINIEKELKKETGKMRARSINNLLKNIQASFIVIVGIAFILTTFWKDLKKLTQTTQNNMRVHLSN